MGVLTQRTQRAPRPRRPAGMKSAGCPDNPQETVEAKVLSPSICGVSHRGPPWDTRRSRRQGGYWDSSLVFTGAALLLGVVVSALSRRHVPALFVRLAVLVVSSASALVLLVRCLMA